MKRNSSKPKELRFSLDIRKKLFTIKLVRHKNKLPIEAMDAPFLLYEFGLVGVPYCGRRDVRRHC